MVNVTANEEDVGIWPNNIYHSAPACSGFAENKTIVVNANEMRLAYKEHRDARNVLTLKENTAL